jgi:hypothetical protein
MLSAFILTVMANGTYPVANSVPHFLACRVVAGVSGLDVDSQCGCAAEILRGPASPVNFGGIDCHTSFETGSQCEVLIFDLRDDSTGLRFGVDSLIDKNHLALERAP